MLAAERSAIPLSRGGRPGCDLRLCGPAFSLRECYGLSYVRSRLASPAPWPTGVGSCASDLLGNRLSTLCQRLRKKRGWAPDRGDLGGFGRTERSGGGNVGAYNVSGQRWCVGLWTRHYGE